MKLADAPHRTEIDAVRVDVSHDDLAAAVGELRAIARAHDLPETVVVQPLVSGHGEAFIGLQARLRPRRGRVVRPRRRARRAGAAGGWPPAAARARRRRRSGRRGRRRGHVRGGAGRQALGHARRSSPPWKPSRELWQHAGAWLDSVDLNPVIVTDDGVAVVDALLVAAPTDGR